LLSISEDSTKFHGVDRVLTALKLLSTDLNQQAALVKKILLSIADNQKEGYRARFFAAKGQLSVTEELSRNYFKAWLESEDEDFRCNTAGYIVDEGVFNDEDPLFQVAQKI